MTNRLFNADPETICDILNEAAYLAHSGIESETFAKHADLLARIHAETWSLAKPENVSNTIWDMLTSTQKRAVANHERMHVEVRKAYAKLDEFDPESPSVVTPRPFAQPATRFIFEEDDDGNKTDHQIACTTDAKPADAAAVIAAPINDDGRSDWQWMRLRDGTLMLVCYPRGDTYMQFSDAGVCDWEWAPKASGHLTVADLLSKLLALPPEAHVNVTIVPHGDVAQDFAVRDVGFDSAVDMLDLFVDLPPNARLVFNMHDNSAPEATTASER
jgi:hypothetical protein